MSGEESRAL